MNNYDTLYGVGLLDDLHNYFPALLYDPSRFQTVQQVLQYVRMQTAQRFNLFSFGQEQYRGQVQPQPQVHTVPLWTPSPPVHSPIVQPFDASGQRPPQTVRVVSTWDDSDISFANEFLSLLGASMTSTPNLGGRVLRSAARLNPLANPFQPVIVRPSQRVIDENSEVLTGISGINCAICQESMDASSRCRRLRACQHTYHQTCIDTWFQESVFCPTCRHDIRERRQQPTQIQPNASSSSSTH